MINQARWLDGWTALHVSAMMGLERVVDILLNAGADPVLASSDGMNASQIAMKHNYKKIAEKIRTCKNRIKNESQIEKKENELENISIFKPNNLIKPQPGLPSSLQKSNDNGMEEMGDEVAWALQMKRDLEEKKRKENELSNKRKNEEEDKNNNTKSTKVAVGTKRMTQEQKLKELKQKMEEEEKQKNNPSQAEQMVNILDVMEKKRQRRMAAKSKMSEKERLEKEQAAVKEAMYDEIIWALQLQKELAEQAGDMENVEKYEKEILLNQEKKDGTFERRQRQKQREEEERIKKEQLAIQMKEQEEIRKQEELKRKKEQALKWAEEQKKIELEMQQKKEKEAFEKLPQWKKDKILREKKRNSSVIEEQEDLKNCKPKVEDSKQSNDSLDHLPKWKRDQILKDKLIAEEKAKQEEQKRLELEAIRMSIRKKLGTQTSNEDTIVKNCDNEMEVDLTTEEEQDVVSEFSDRSEASVTSMVIEEENRNEKDCDINKNKDEMLQQLEKDRLALEEQERLRLEEKRRMEEKEAQQQEKERLRALEEERQRVLEEERLREVKKNEEEKLRLRKIEEENKRKEKEMELRRREEEIILQKETERLKRLEEERLAAEKSAREKKKLEEQETASYLSRVEERIRKRQEEEQKKAEEARKSAELQYQNYLEELRRKEEEKEQKSASLKKLSTRSQNEEELSHNVTTNKNERKDLVNMNGTYLEKKETDHHDFGVKKKEDDDEEMRLYLLKVEERMRKRSEEANRKQEEERKRFLEIEKRKEEERQRELQERKEREEQRQRIEKEIIEAEDAERQRTLELQKAQEKERLEKEDRLRKEREEKRILKEQNEEKERLLREEKERNFNRVLAIKKAMEEEEERLKREEEEGLKREEEERLKRGEEKERLKREEEERLKKEERFQIEEEERLQREEEDRLKREDENRFKGNGTEEKEMNVMRTDVNVGETKDGNKKDKEETNMEVENDEAPGDQKRINFTDIGEKITSNEAMKERDIDQYVKVQLCEDGNFVEPQEEMHIKELRSEEKEAEEKVLAGIRLTAQHLDEVPTVPQRRSKESIKSIKDDTTNEINMELRNASNKGEAQNDLTATCCDEKVDSIKSKKEIFPTKPERRSKVQLCDNEDEENVTNLMKESQLSNTIKSKNCSGKTENGEDGNDQESIFHLIQTAKEGKVDLHSNDNDNDDEEDDDEDQKKERIKSKDQLDSFIAMIQSRLNEVKLLKEKKLKENSQGVVEDEESPKDEIIEKKPEIRIRIKVPQKINAMDTEHQEEVVNKSDEQIVQNKTEVLNDELNTVKEVTEHATSLDLGFQGKGEEYEVNECTDHQGSAHLQEGLYKNGSLSDDTESETMAQIENEESDDKQECKMEANKNVDTDIDSSTKAVVDPDVRHFNEPKEGTEVKYDVELEVEPEFEAVAEPKIQIEFEVEPQCESEVEGDVESEVEHDIDLYVNPDVAKNQEQERLDSLQHQTHHQNEDRRKEFRAGSVNEGTSNDHTDRNLDALQDIQNNNCDNGKENIMSEAKGSHGKSNEEKMMLERLISMVQSKINFAKESKAKEKQCQE